MRTISEQHRDRLIAQAQEADTQGLTKLAEALTIQLEKTSVRGKFEDYSYANESFEKDARDILWGLVVRASDFHGNDIDPVEADKLVEVYAVEFVKDLRKMAGIKPVGKYEPKVMGEVEED